MAGSTQAINLVLDGPPDLTAGSDRFVEADDRRPTTATASPSGPGPNRETATGPCGSTAYHPATTINHQPPRRGDDR
jgi:hypothetical protein